MKTKANNFWSIWLWPIILGGLSLLGLVAGLLGDGWLDLISWASLGLLAVVCAYTFKH